MQMVLMGNTFLSRSGSLREFNIFRARCTGTMVRMKFL